jgi:hypothetical protein
MSLSEFFGFGGYSRPAEGYMSWQHLLFVTTLNVIMIVCAVIIGRKVKNGDEKQKNKVLIITAFLINAFELFKIVILSFRHGDPLYFRFVLPLFMCSIQLITIPIAAFSKGKAKEASLDFVMIFGLLGAVFGTYFAGNNYAVYPVIGMDNVISGITHCLAGFASLYIMFSGIPVLKKKIVKPIVHEGDSYHNTIVSPSYVFSPKNPFLQMDQKKSSPHFPSAHSKREKKVSSKSCKMLTRPPPLFSHKGAANHEKLFQK